MLIHKMEYEESNHRGRYNSGPLKRSKARTGDRHEGWAFIALKEDFSGMIK